jgi:hypothetical protein
MQLAFHQSTHNLSRGGDVAESISTFKHSRLTWEFADGQSELQKVKTRIERAERLEMELDQS